MWILLACNANDENLRRQRRRVGRAMIHDAHSLKTHRVSSIAPPAVLAWAVDLVYVPL